MEVGTSGFTPPLLQGEVHTHCNVEVEQSSNTFAVQRENLAGLEQNKVKQGACAFLLYAFASSVFSFQMLALRATI